MIQLFQFTVPLGDRDPDETVAALREHVARLVRLNAVLRGMKATTEAGTLTLVLRCAGHNRWRISSDCRRIAASLLRRVRLDWRAAQLELVSTEPTARSLTKEQGRTVVPRPSRVTQDGSPWDHIPWWGDDVVDPLG